MPGLVGRFNVVNIKLDKCGGLTEGLAMAHEAKRLGLERHGRQHGRHFSLAMAPAFVLGQLCDIVDLDGPIFLAHDRDTGDQLRRRNGLVQRQGLGIDPRGNAVSTAVIDRTSATGSVSRAG